MEQGLLHPAPRFYILIAAIVFTLGQFTRFRIVMPADRATMGIGQPQTRTETSVLNLHIQDQCLQLGQGGYEVETRDFVAPLQKQIFQIFELRQNGKITDLGTLPDSQCPKRPFDFG